MHTDAFAGRLRISVSRAGFTLAIAVLTTIFVSSPAAGPALAAPALSSTALSGAPNPSNLGETVTFAARVGGSNGGTPTGTVAFKHGAKTLGSGILKTLGAATTIASGSEHSCALTAAGGVKCWGNNDSSQLGDGNSPVKSEIPVDVVGLTSGVVAIVAGGSHTCALLAGGGVKCWGENAQGQFGDDNSPSDSQIPVDVVGLTSGVAAISGGGLHTCAVTNAGGAKCWGFNAQGQIGDNSLINRHAPVDVIGLTSGISAIEAGNNHACALTDAGGLKCWGFNVFGRLGDGTTTQRLTPVNVVGLASGVASVSAGLGTCVVTVAGGAKCWGDNTSGQVGDGTTIQRETPTDVDGLTSGVVAVQAAGFHNCALTTGGGVKCWGGNNEGEFGNNNAPTPSHTPIDVDDLASGVSVLSAYGTHSCVQTDDGGAKCWGFNNRGQLGDNSTLQRHAPVAVSGLGAGTTLIFGEAVVSSAKLDAGKNKITALYGGDAGHNPSTSQPLTHRVFKGKARTTAFARPNKRTAGQTIILKAKVKAVSPARGKPNGRVTFWEKRKKIGVARLKNGKATFRFRKLVAGKHKIKAKYRPGMNWRALNSAVITFTVKPKKADEIQASKVQVDIWTTAFGYRRAVPARPGADLIAGQSRN